MPYTQVTMRKDLEQIGVGSWDWAGDVAKLPIDLATGRQPTRPAQDVTGEISQYCWCAYEKAYRGSGDQVIGRVNHLSAAGLFEKVAEIVDKQTLLAGGTKGNLLKMDKWARVVNDSWVLGGIHRGSNFRLASPRVMENLWNFNVGVPVVTAREILGLLHFGYRMQQIGPWQVLTPADRGRAAQASIVEYDKLMQSEGTIRNVLKLVDRSRLKVS